MEDDAGVHGPTVVLRLLGWLGLFGGLAMAVWSWLRASDTEFANHIRDIRVINGFWWLAEGLAVWALFLTVARISDNVAAMRAAATSPLPEPKPALPATAVPTETFEGMSLERVTEHGLGVRWAVTPDGRIVYGTGESDWKLYDPTTTNLRPPLDLTR